MSGQLIGGFGLRGGQFEGDDCASRWEVVGGVEQDRDYRCEEWIGSTDPRFTGAYLVAGNYDTHRETAGAFEDGSFTVSTVARRVENEDGAWVAPTTVEAWWASEGGVQTEVTIPTETLVFSGEGDYEGLTAVLWMNPYIRGSQLWGVIFRGEPPAAPTDAR